MKLIMVLDNEKRTYYIRGEEIASICLEDVQGDVEVQFLMKSNRDFGFYNSSSKFYVFDEVKHNWEKVSYKELPHYVFSY